MSSITHYSACCPAALARLLGESYEAAWWRLKQEGTDPSEPSSQAVHRALELVGILSVHSYRRRPLFSRWRRGRDGRWLVIVTGGGSGGHAIALKDGAALDNGWAMGYGDVMSLRVHAAWRIV